MDLSITETSGNHALLWAELGFPAVWVSLTVITWRFNTDLLDYKI